jgi:hypothetical protein
MLRDNVEVDTYGFGHYFTPSRIHTLFPGSLRRLLHIPADASNVLSAASKVDDRDPKPNPKRVSKYRVQRLLFSHDT